MPHTQLAGLILDESGYTAMWQQDKSPQAQSRLENLKELIRFLGEFESLEGFLEHVSLVMDAEAGEDGDRISLMTLHGAKGLEFDTVFLPGWEEGLFPHQRAMDESGQAGLEEERRLAYVGVTRARKQAFMSFAQNRRVHALWQSQIPSRFVDELPEASCRGGRGARRQRWLRWHRRLRQEPLRRAGCGLPEPLCDARLEARSDRVVEAGHSPARSCQGALAVGADHHRRDPCRFERGAGI